METNEPAVEHWAHTKSKLFKLNFTWTIHNYSFRQKRSGESISSPVFSLNSSCGIKWCMKLFPNGDEECKGFVSIYLKLLQNVMYAEEILAEFRISVLNIDPVNTISSASQVSRDYLFQSLWGFEKFTKSGILLDEAYGFLQDNKLKIICELRYIAGNIDVSSQKSVGVFKVPECKISDDLGNLLDCQKYSDVTLVAGEHEFPAHKAILAARSDVFAAMFDNEMEEKKSGRVIIDDINHEVIQEMLQFIYRGETRKLKQLANHLLAAADKYALEKLKAMSEEALYAELSIEAAAETLVLADLHSANQLKEQTTNFIKNHRMVFLRTKGWINMLNENTHSALVAETLQALCK